MGGFSGGLSQNTNQGGIVDLDKKTKPTKELLAYATTGDVCRMIRTYRDTSYQDVLLKLLFDLSLEVWTKNDLLPDYILEALNSEEEQKLRKMYRKDPDNKQNPLITLILGGWKRKDP